MPFKLIKSKNGYFVENNTTGKRYSKKPMTKENAVKQFGILNKYLTILEGSGLNKQEIKQITRQPLSDLDIRKYFPNAKILSISELETINDINRLLPKSKDVAFLLYESKDGYGHWVLISKYEGQDPSGNPRTLYEYNDSYGNPIDAPLGWNSPETNRHLDNEPYLTKLLKQEQNKGKEIIYSTKNFQSEKPEVANCGRYCVMRASTILNDNQELSDYIKMMNEIKNITDYNYDTIVSGIINI